MANDEETVIGPKIPQTSSNPSKSRLISKLNHFFDLKSTKGLSLNQQLSTHPDFHAPGITENLLDVMGLDPWGSNLADDVAKPFWENLETETFDYLKVAADQRQIWESKNPQIMNAAPKSTNNPSNTTSTKNTFNPRTGSGFSQQPRKRI